MPFIKTIFFSEITGLILAKNIKLKAFFIYLDKKLLLPIPESPIITNFIKVSNGEYKFFPFIIGIGEQYESSNNINIIAFIMIDMISLDENVVLTTQQYYYQKNKDELIKFLTPILRGKLSHDELKKNGKPYFHTTCYGLSDINWLYSYDANDKSIVEGGSFLIARVGKRCVGRVKYLEKGNIQISDCIYGVTVPKGYIEDFKTYFNSKEYSDFIKVVARGVCSLYICRGDLESMLLRKIEDFRKKRQIG